MTCAACMRAIGLGLGLAVSGAMAADEPASLDPDKVAQSFMAAVVEIQAATSIPGLEASAGALELAAMFTPQALVEMKRRVEALRADIKALDSTIKDCHVDLVVALGSGNTSIQEAQLKDLTTRRKDLVKKESAAYRDYAWSFPLSADRADLLGEHFFVDKFPSKCSSKVDEKYTSAGEQALGARISEREIGRHRGGWGQRAQAVR